MGKKKYNNWTFRLLSGKWVKWASCIGAILGLVSILFSLFMDHQLDPNGVILFTGMTSIFANVKWFKRESKTYFWPVLGFIASCITILAFAYESVRNIYNGFLYLF